MDEKFQPKLSFNVDSVVRMHVNYSLTSTKTKLTKETVFIHSRWQEVKR